MTSESFTTKYDASQKGYSPYKYSNMLDFCVYAHKAEYVMYVPTNKRKNIKLSSPLHIIGDEVIQQVFKKLDCNQDEIQVSSFEILRLISPAKYLNLQKQFQRICDQHNLIFIGFTNDYIVTLDAKGELMSANAYLESSYPKKKDKPYIVQIVVTDEMTKGSPPIIRPQSFGKYPNYKFKPNTNSPDDYATELHACIYDVNGNYITYNKNHQKFYDKLEKYLSAQIKRE